MKLDIRYFIVSLSLGLFYVYLSDDKPVMVIYPTPENIDLFQYKKSGTCFSYDFHEVTCPINSRNQDVSKDKK